MLDYRRIGVVGVKLDEVCGEFSYLRFSRSITIINVVAYLYACFIHDT